MAATNFVKTSVEPWVRARLEERLHQPFAPRVLQLRTGAERPFDAVSEDNEVVVSIGSGSRQSTLAGLAPATFYHTVAELYFLSLIDAPMRALVVTNPALYALLEERLRGLVPPKVSLECIALPKPLQDELDRQLPLDGRPATEYAE